MSEHCRKLIEQSPTLDSAAKNRKKVYRELVSSEAGVFSDDIIMNFVLSNAVLDIAIGYLGEVPILQKVSLWRSRPISSELSGSQYYHLDAQFTRQVKFFVLLSDVTLSSGPLTLIPINESNKLKMKLNHDGGKLTDDQVFQHVDKKSEVYFTGKVGDVLVANSSRCYHYGSRCQTEERWVLMFHFVTLLELEKLDASRSILASKFSQDQIRRLVVSSD